MYGDRSGRESIESGLLITDSPEAVWSELFTLSTHSGRSFLPAEPGNTKDIFTRCAKKPIPGARRLPPLATETPTSSSVQPVMKRLPQVKEMVRLNAPGRGLCADGGPERRQARTIPPGIWESFGGCREPVAPLQGLAVGGSVTQGCARASLHRLARPPTSTDPLLLLAGPGRPLNLMPFAPGRFL